jgi:hypothetical protein
MLRPTLPKRLDEVTTLTAVDHQGKRQRFYYIVEPEKKPIPQVFIETVRSQSLSHVCPDRRSNGLDAGITMEFIYRDKQMRDLGTFTIASGDCKDVARSK